MSTLPSPPAPINNYVVYVQYVVSANNNLTPPTIASINTSANFSIDTTKNPTPYSQLTEQQVLGWIQAIPNLVANTESGLDAQINLILNPPVTPSVTPLPWAS